MRKNTIFFLFLLFSCGTEGNSDIGKTCNDNEDCKSLPTGYCAAAGACTARCYTHETCGCPPDTVNQDIAMGLCDVACIDIPDSDTSLCFRTCFDENDCDPGFSCVYPSESTPYRICF